MIYVALLRGINVGGNAKVSMSELKAALDQAGLQAVKTYINSGNIVFKDDMRTPDELVSLIEKTIQTECKLDVKVLVRDMNAVKAVCEALPETWRNDTTMKCDVLFLWDEIDNESIL